MWCFLQCQINILWTSTCSMCARLRSTLHIYIFVSQRKTLISRHKWISAIWLQPRWWGTDVGRPQQRRNWLYQSWSSVFSTHRVWTHSSNRVSLLKLHISCSISYILYCKTRWIDRIVLNWCRYQTEQQMAIATSSAGPSTVPLMPPGWLAWSTSICVMTSKYVPLVYIVTCCVVCEDLTWTCIRLWDCVLLSS